MKMLRLGLPVVLALFALTGAPTTAFAAGNPADAALTPAAGPGQEADDADLEATDGETGGDVDVRPDRDRPDHRPARICARAHDATVGGDVARDVASILQRCRDFLSDQIDRHPGAVCRRVAESELDGDRIADLLARCRDHLGDVTDLDPGQICRRAHDADPSRDVAGILERCREHIGDATDLDPAQLCRRAAHSELDGDRGSELLARCREHFGDAVSDRPGDVCRKAIDSDSNRDVASVIARCREHIGDAVSDRPGDVCRKAIDSDSNRDVASVIARCREHFGHDRAPGRLDGPNVDRIRDALTGRLQNADGEAADGRVADAIRARLAQLDGSDRGELLRKRNQRTDRPQRVPSFRVPGEPLPAQVQ